MKTKIVAVRHGETEWNKLEKQQGQLNSSLTEIGRLQADAMGEGLQHIRFDVFYTSDLGRAIETSEIISHFINIEYIPDPRLRERHLGALQGLTKKEFKEKYPEEWPRFTKNDPDYALPGGESIRQRYTRVVECIENIAARHRGSNVLVVSHGGVLMSMFQKALQLPLDRERTFSLYNGSINGFSISHSMKWTLEVWGDIHHMEKRGIGALDDT